jgi:hypothetical protein
MFKTFILEDVFAMEVDLGAEHDLKFDTVQNIQGMAMT